MPKTPKKGSDIEKLMNTVSFELDTNLRLHPQKLEIGKAELLTDAITLPFVDIEKKLDKYVTTATKEEGTQIRSEMKRYLQRLNSNQLLPLHFRLKVLKRFQKELDLLDAELTAQILNSHKIGLEMVQDSAKTKSSLYPVLVDMVSDAIEVADTVQRHDLLKHRPQSVMAVRQALDIARLGLSVVSLLEEGNELTRNRLWETISIYELTRKLDFFSKSKSEQKIILRELKNHIGVLEPELYRKDEPDDSQVKGTTLASFLGKPHELPAVLPNLPVKPPCDIIFIPLDRFLDRLVTAVNRMESLLNNPELQNSDLHTEAELLATIRGGNSIITTLHHRKRAAKRRDSAGLKTVIEWKPEKAMINAYSLMVSGDYEFAPHENILAEAWSVIEYSDTGAQLERIDFTPPSENMVGSLANFSWIPYADAPKLGFVRWLKASKPGEYRMGVEFFPHRCHLCKGRLHGSGDDDMRQWPLLVRRVKDAYEVWFPDAKIFTGTVFALELKESATPSLLKVSEITETGPNYSRCIAKPAKKK